MWKDVPVAKDVDKKVTISGFKVNVGDPNWPWDLGQLILHARLEAGITQQALAARCGTTASALARVERGNDGRVPGLDLLGRIAVALGLKLVVGFEP